MNLVQHKDNIFPKCLLQLRVRLVVVLYSESLPGVSLQALPSQLLEPLSCRITESTLSVFQEEPVDLGWLSGVLETRSAFIQLAASLPESNLWRTIESTAPSH
jgi:hypothetical protein